MLEPWRSQVPDSVAKGIIKAQIDISKACKGMLCWGPEYLITVAIFKSLLTIRALRSNVVLEMPARKVADINTLGRKWKNSRTDKLCRCDIVLWEGENKRAVIEVKRSVKNCVNDVPRLRQFFEDTPRMHYGILAACMQEEVKNRDVPTSESKIVSKLETLSTNIREQIGRDVELFPENAATKIISVCAEDGDGESRHYVWRPVCFVIHNNRS